MLVAIYGITTYYLLREIKLREGKKRGRKMCNKQNKIIFYTSLLSKLNLLTEEQKQNIILKKNG
ncbi:hypothetical protein [Metabacillus fastidiosus]|uniref:hypothetical protein n=1 Tax=Metabacillus fastidiosus TaxID=1458 RepID=UPI003D29E5D2